MGILETTTSDKPKDGKIEIARCQNDVCTLCVHPWVRDPVERTRTRPEQVIPLVRVQHGSIRKRRITLNQISATPKPDDEAPRARGRTRTRSQALIQMPDWLEAERRHRLDELLSASGNRRLANQDLVDRFIRESERCIRS